MHWPEVQYWNDAGFLVVYIRGKYFMPKPTCDKRRRRAAPKARDAEGVQREALKLKARSAREGGAVPQEGSGRLQC